MPRTLAPAPPTDRRFWRRLIARAHPDAGGDHDLFLFAQSVFEHVAGDGIEPVPTLAARTPPRHHPPTTDADRIDFTLAFDRAGSFAELTALAVRFSGDRHRPEHPYAALLAMLADCAEAGPDDVAAYRSQHVGATYKQLAYIAHLAGLDRGQRARWYRIAEGIPLAQRHAGHLIAKLQA